MSDQGDAGVGRWLLTVGAGLALLTVPLTTGIPQATAQGTACPADLLDWPVWISQVSFLHDGAEVTQAPFVNPGDVVGVTVRADERTDNPACHGLLTAPGEDRVSDLQARLIYAPGGQDGSADHAFATTCSITEAGGSCTFQGASLVAGPGAGEHRVRVLVGQQDGDTFTPLAGAERVLVVEARPDLSVTGAAWSTAEQDRVTHYVHEDAYVQATTENLGTYPSWDPNGGDAFWGRSSFDGPDADLAPDERVRPDHAEHETRERVYTAEDVTSPTGQLPTCTWHEAIPCSYKRGAPLDLAFLSELHRDGELLETREDLVYTDEVSDLGQQAWDKDSDTSDQAWVALLQPDGPVAAKTFVVEGFDLFEKAGDLQLTLTADAATGPQDDRIPELDEVNNAYAWSLHVLGVDLRLHGPAEDAPLVQPVSADGSPLACGTSQDPCPAGTLVEVQASYRNVGDDRAEFPEGTYDEVAQRSWRAGVLLDGAIAALAHQDALAVTQQENVVAPGETVALFSGLTVLTDPTGGTQTVAVALDHPTLYDPDAYDGGELPPPAGELGRVAEATEGNACPEDGSTVDNLHCVTLHFEEVTPEPGPGPVDLLIDTIEHTTRQLETHWAKVGPQPWAGQDVTITVANHGDADAASGAKLTLHACAAEPAGPAPAPGATCELVDTWTLHPLSAGQAVDLETTWDTWGKVGEFQLCATLAYEGQQTTEENDDACSRTFVVAGGTGLGGLRVV